MTPRSVNAPTVPIPFHRLLKVVAVVDRADAQTKQLLEHIAHPGELLRRESVSGLIEHDQACGRKVWQQRTSGSVAWTLTYSGDSR